MIIFLKSKKVRERKCKRNPNMHCSLLDSTATVFLLVTVQFQNILNNQCTLHNEKKNVFWFLYLHVGYVEDIKQLLFTLTKPEMAEVYSRYSAKAPEPLSAQFNDRIDKQSAVKAYNEKCGKVRNIPLFPSGISLSRFRCCFVLIFASHNSLLGNLVKKAILFT